MAVLVLGCPVVIRDRSCLRPSRRSVSVLLGVFGLRPNRRLAVDWLIGALWPQRPPPSAAANLRSHIAELRRLLGAGPYIERADDAYVLAAVPSEVDSAHFLDLVNEARNSRDEGDNLHAAHLLTQALALWRGPVLEGILVPSAVQPQATILDEEHLSATEELIDVRLDLGHHRALVPELKALVREHPLRERLWHQLLLALAAVGRRSEVVDHYRLLAHVLDTELGVRPSQAVTELHDLVRGGG